MKNLRFLLLALSLCMGLTGSISVSAQEKILSFSSDITIMSNGKLDVTETIRVQTQGIRIQRGIFRTFPTVYRREDGKKISVGFKVREVLRDGQPEPYHQEPLLNGKAVYIGHESVFLSPGVYTYTISYETTRQVGFFSGYDELYWNVTGLDWDFVIDSVRARVFLPEGARVLREQGFTGVALSRDKGYKAVPTADGGYEFYTLRPLSPGEGLTIAVSWPKGFVNIPDFSQQLEFLLTHRLSLLIGIAGMLLLMFYYIVLFNRVGRDPEPGNLQVRFSPPEGISPGAARYLMRQGFDKKTFTAAIVGMAVKDLLHIQEEQDGTYALSLKPLKGKMPTQEEKSLHQVLSKNGDYLRLTQSNHQVITQSIQRLKADLKAQFQPTYFRTNSKWLVPGIIFASVLLGIMIWDFIQNGLSPYFHDVGVAIATVTGFLDLMFIHIPFSIWLKAPTAKGRKVLDELEGYKKYLLASDKEVFSQSPAQDPVSDVFERNLPYAIALSAADEWGKQFDEALHAAGTQNLQGGYVPLWYFHSHSAGSWSGFDDATGFTNSLSHSLDSSISSASTPPGSDSSFSGGGFSGGGGGGGGGGGW